MRILIVLREKNGGRYNLDFDAGCRMQERRLAPSRLVTPANVTLLLGHHSPPSLHHYPRLFTLTILPNPFNSKDTIHLLCCKDNI